MRATGRGRSRNREQYISRVTKKTKTEQQKKLIASREPQSHLTEQKRAQQRYVNSQVGKHSISYDTASTASRRV